MVDSVERIANAGCNEARKAESLEYRDRGTWSRDHERPRKAIKRPSRGTSPEVKALIAEFRKKGHKLTIREAKALLATRRANAKAWTTS